MPIYCVCFEIAPGSFIERLDAMVADKNYMNKNLNECLSIPAEILVNPNVPWANDSPAELEMPGATVPETLALLGPTVRVSSSACLLACELSPAEVMNRVAMHVFGHRQQERILILTIDRNTVYRLHNSHAEDRDLINWFDQNWPWPP